MKTVLLVAIRPIGSPSVNSQHNIPTFKIKDSGFRHVKQNCCDGFNFKENYWNICITLTVSVQLVSGDDNLRMRRALLRGRVSMRMNGDGKDDKKQDDIDDNGRLEEDEVALHGRP